MDRALTDYVQQNKNTDREVHYTHVSCVRPKGRYAFGRSELEGFWELYCDRLASNPAMVSGMAEIPQEYSMLVVDGDIKKKIADVLKTHPEIKTEVKDGDDVRIKYMPIRLYNEEHIGSVIKAYQDVITSVTKDFKPEHCVCILLEKDPYVSDDYIKSGFHLAFINYFCSKPLQDTYLIPRVVDKVNEMEIFADLGYTTSSDVLDISKKHTAAKPWLLYGSRKSETSGTYRVSKAFAENAEEISLEDAFDGYKLYNGFEKPIEYKSYEDLTKLFPRVFSVNPCFRKTVDIVPVFDASANITFTEERPERDDVKYDQTYEQQMATAKELIELLDVSRAEKRDEWLEIGWILYAISNGSEDGLNLWIEFSQQSPDKFSLEVCLREWSRMYKGNFTLGSLKYYAKIDSPEDYEVFWRGRLEKMVSKAINGSHNDLAKALYESYSTEYVCASLKPEMWFYYTNHHWEPMEEGIELRKKISDDLVHRYSAMIKDQFDQLADADDDDSGGKKETEGRIATIYKLIKNLKSNTFKNSIMKECREVFYDRNFLKRLGKGKYLLALQNGVYDLQNHVFRPGKPEDYIAFQMPIVYREFNDLDPWVVETYNFFEKVFPDPSIREYVMDRLAEMLVGGNKRKHVYFWTGRGNNGKSVMKSLIQRMLGAYFIDIPNSVLVGQKPKSGQACPELARADRGVRAAFTQEPNKKDLVNTGALKEYSGNDTFYARTLFEKGGEIDPMFKLVMICLAGETKVSLSSGVSLPIEKMTANHSVMSWNGSGLVKAEQTRWLNQGTKECVELTLLDGRTIKCTPDHRFLTSAGEWVEAKDIIIGETSLKMGIDSPLCADFFDHCDYKFEAGEMKFDMSSHSDRLKAMAFCRLMGYQLTDGSQNTSMYLGHLLDANQLLDDVELLTGKRPKVSMCNNTYKVHLPIELTLAMSAISPIQVGGRCHNPMTLPEFVFDEKCPTFLIREFLAGTFGGDGIVPSLTENSVQGSLQLVASKAPEFVGSLTEKYNQLKNVLLNRFNIASHVSEPSIYGEEGNQHVFLIIGGQSEMLKYSDCIGMRYCCHKSYRMTAVSSYIRYKQAIISQNQVIINRVRELMEQKMSIKNARFQAISEIVPIDEECLVTYTQVGRYIRENKEYNAPNINRHLSRFIDVCQLRQFGNGALSENKYSVPRTATSLPCYQMLVTDRKNCGILPVYDITVQECSNFIANGIVTHNCNDLPGITTNDPAVWNRLRVIPFEATFVDNPPADEEEQFRTKTFLKDENFDEKLDNMLEPLFWILTQRLPKIKRVIYEPPKVKEATEKYRRSQDVYAQFIDERMIEDDSKYINIMDFFQAFRDWHRQAFPGIPIPNRNDCNDYLTDVWGSPVNYRWAGYRLRTDRDDIADGRADENESVSYEDNGGSNPLAHK